MRLHHPFPPFSNRLILRLKAFFLQEEEGKAFSSIKRCSDKGKGRFVFWENVSYQVSFSFLTFRKFLVIPRVASNWSNSFIRRGRRWLFLTVAWITESFFFFEKGWESRIATATCHEYLDTYSVSIRLGQKSRWISQLQLSSKTSFALSRIYSPVRDLLRVKCNLKSREFVFEPSILEFLFLSWFN